MGSWHVERLCQTAMVHFIEGRRSVVGVRARGHASLNIFRTIFFQCALYRCSMCKVVTREAECSPESGRFGARECLWQDSGQ